MGEFLRLEQMMDEDPQHDLRRYFATVEELFDGVERHLKEPLFRGALYRLILKFERLQ
jgi:hypothetical protein